MSALFRGMGISPRALFRLLISLQLSFLLPSLSLAEEETEEQVSSLLRKMTLEEKAGQMTQLTLGAISSSEATSENPEAHQFDMDKLRHALINKHVGSILNVHNVAFSAKQWRKVLTQVQTLATEETRLQIPILYGIDSVHGANYVREGTLFPHNLGLAATRNPLLVERCHAVTALETRSAGIPWNFGPSLDVGRQPVWSRYVETFGEDVHITTVMAEASVRGLQGSSLSSRKAVAATAKHFLAYSLPTSGQDRTQTLLPEHYLREYFLPPFKNAIEQGVQAIMVNSGEVNGVPIHASHEMLSVLLREELKFDGVIVSDWEDVKKLHNLHRVAPDLKEAVRMSVHAGIDMCMAPYDFHFSNNLIKLVKEGAIPESRLDESVRRILRMKFSLGLFNEPVPPASNAGEIGSEEAHRLSLQAARESLILLKNEGVLPLEKKGQILLTGPGCHSLAALHGSWSYTWQGTDEEAYPEGLQTILQSFNDGYGRENVLWARGAQWDGSTDFDYAMNKARNADVVVCVLGEKPSTETPGNIPDLSMPDNQLRLVRRLATGKPLILVLLGNRPRLITEIAGHCHAIVYAGQPGPHGGKALYELLTGQFNPSGRLPFTYPRHPNSLLTYDHKYSDSVGPDKETPGFNPLYEFGHGLSYTSFAFSDLKLKSSTLTKSDEILLSVRVSNTGSRAGKETVHVFTRDLFASITPQVKRLRAFSQIELKAGESKVVTFKIPVKELAYHNLESTSVLEPGEFDVMVGDLTERILVK